MNAKRMPLGVLVMVPVMAGFGLYAFTNQQQVEDPNATPEATLTLTATPFGQTTTFTPPSESDIATATSAAETSTALAWQPTPMPTPLRSHGAFHEGAWVRVNAGAGDCLNARNNPSLSVEYVIVNTCLPDGFEGYITGHTAEADGHWWWYLAGTGWVAEDYLVFVRDADLRGVAMLPALAGKGRIAFLRGTDIWLMEADGDNQRIVLDRGGEDEPWNNTPQDLTWSPDGTMLSFNVGIYDQNGMKPPVSELHVLDLRTDPPAERMFSGVYGGDWSPDSTRIGIVREPTAEPMGSGNEGVPGVIEIATGAQLVFGSERFWQQRPPSFNHDGTKLLVSYHTYSETDGSRGAILIWDTDGNELHRLEQPAPEEGFYSMPRWSPVDDTIAFHASIDGRPRFVVYDPATGAFLAEADVPKASDKIGGRCGGGDMWQMKWSRDGRSILYGFSFGDTGANGIWTWDIASGEQRLAPAGNAGPTSAGPDGWFVFSAYGFETSHIFAGTSGGGFPRIITDGSSPVWSPQ